MAKAKFDAKKAIGLLTSRSEILIAVVGACLVVVCLLLGVSTYLGASSPEPAIQSDIKAANDRLIKAPAPPKSDSIKPPDITWTRVTAGYLMPWFGGGAAAANARTNPQILMVDNDTEGKSFQLDFVHQGILVYDTKAQDKINAFQAGGAMPIPMLVVAAKRMVVVNGTFPYRDQAEMHRKALRVDKLDELFDKGYAPTFDGLNVERRKIIYKDGKAEPGPWAALYMQEGSGVKTAKEIEKAMKTAVLDDNQGLIYRDVIHGSSVTPLPKLAGGIGYPNIQLPAVANRLPQDPIDPKKKDELKKSNARPIGSPPSRILPVAGPEAQWVAVNIADLPDQAAKEQLAGHLNWFNPYGIFPDEPKTADGGPQKQPPNEKAKKGGNVDLDGIINMRARNTEPVNAKALIRFIDIDVEPGKIYEYRIQVRMANPNFMQPAQFLAHSGLAEIKELVSEWAYTPTIAIPADAGFKLFITHREKGFVSHVKPPKGNTLPAPGLVDKYVPFEVHRFVDVIRDKNGSDHYIADWIIAERILVARGEPIGREFNVEMAEWNKRKTAWDLGGVEANKVTTGLTVDLRTDPPITLLDFTGGAQSETEALLLMPDLTMKLRNSRTDNDEQNSPPAIERQLMFDAWKTRLEDLRRQLEKKDKDKKDKGR